MDLARLVASWSKDPSTQVGAVIVDQDKRARRYAEQKAAYEAQQK